MNCPHCQKELPKWETLEWCPFCQRDLTSGQIVVEPPAPSSAGKMNYWLIFWLAFFGGPILGFLSITGRGGRSFLSFPLVGAIVSGFALAKICAKTIPGVILLGMIFSVVVAVVYVGILFVGCLVALQH